jgi:hypothetical protein
MDTRYGNLAVETRAVVEAVYQPTPTYILLYLRALTLPARGTLLVG